ncbi:MAG: restriction endonuclease [Chloroflexi bacterium]|nr:restriction endonuclease [Chloroflexota bacterium]
MPIPDYESLMLPLLKLLSDKKEHEATQVNELLTTEFNLSDEEKSARLPSGAKPVIYSRVHWAKTYLKSAGLLESTGWGRYQITERGLDVLAKNPTGIDNKYLSQFPEFIEFKKRSKKIDSKDEIEESSLQTPDELLETSYQNLRTGLAEDLLERIRSSSPKFFEQLVVDVLVSMGYGGSKEDASAVGRSGDGGIDGIIKEDKLVLDAVYIQAKRWDAPVGRPIVQNFVGSLEGYRATKGVLITTSRFAQSAFDYVKSISKKIVLIDGEQLAQFMIDHDVGVTELATYRIKKVDPDYFGEE